MTTVIIWNNNIVSSVLPGQHRYSGHAALSIDDDWTCDGSAVDNYVSFWPEGGHSTTQQILGANSIAKETLISDLEAEGYAPDHVLRLSGLNLTAMRAKWNELRSDSVQYRFFRNSCSTVAARVLKSGTSVKTAGHIVWSPLDVKRLALSLGAQPISWALLLREMETCGMINASEETMLSGLGKRDARHGSSTGNAYFARGKRIADKSIMGKRGPVGGYRIFAGGSRPGLNEARDATEVDQTGNLQSGTMTLMNIFGSANRSWEDG